MRQFTFSGIHLYLHVHNFKLQLTFFRLSRVNKCSRIHQWLILFDVLFIRCMVPRDRSVSKTHDMTQALCGGVKDKPKWMAIMKGRRALEQAQTEWWNYGCVRTCVIWSTFCNPIRRLVNLLWCNPSKTTLFKTFALGQTLNSQNLRSARESPKNSSPPLVSIGKRGMWTV